MRNLSVILFVMALFSIAGCGKSETVQEKTWKEAQARSATGTTTSSDPTPSPDPIEVQWNPIYGFDPGTSTGVHEVDTVMAAISALDLEMLVALTITQAVPCTTTAMVPTANRCPPGADAGTSLPIVFAEFCSGSVAFPFAEVRAIFRPLLDGRPRLWGLRELPPDHPSSKRPGAPPSRYVLFVVNNSDPPSGFTLILGADSRIQSVNYGCGERPDQVWQSWSTTGAALLSPPLAPRPR